MSDLNLLICVSRQCTICSWEMSAVSLHISGTARKAAHSLSLSPPFFSKIFNSSDLIYREETDKCPESFLTRWFACCMRREPRIPRDDAEWVRVYLKVPCVPLFPRGTERHFTLSLLSFWKLVSTVEGFPAFTVNSFML